MEIVRYPINIFTDLEVTNQTDIRGRLLAEDAASAAEIKHVVDQGNTVDEARQDRWKAHPSVHTYF
jgi:hypothetical protein